MNLLQYWKALKAHDWDSDRSDDQSVWRRGHEERAKLRELGKTSFDHGQMWSAFHSHWVYGGNANYPQPKRPTILEWAQGTYAERMSHVAEYKNEDKVTHRFEIRRVGKNYHLYLNRERVKAGKSVKELKQHAGEML